MKSVLITGGAGFIGYHLATHLTRGYAVTLCDNLYRNKTTDRELSTLIRKNNIEFLNLDLTSASDWAKLKGDFDFVYHLAAVNGTKNFYESPHEVMRINLQCMLNLLDWARHARVGKILYASTSEVYAGAANLGLLKYPTPEESPIIFSDIYNPRWSYASTKFVDELLMIHYARVLGLRWSIVRYHNVYGPRMGYDHVIPELHSKLVQDSQVLELKGANNKRCFCYIDDAIWATIRVAESKTTDFKIINVGNDLEETTILKLAALICKQMSFKPRVIAMSAPDGSTLRRKPSLRKLRALTGYKPKVDLKTGLRRTLDWYDGSQRMHHAKK